MIKHDYQAQELTPKDGKVSGQAWNADHKLGVGFSMLLGAWEFQIGTGSATFFGESASRVSAGVYNTTGPTTAHDAFAEACANGFANGQLVIIPHSPLPSGWRFSVTDDLYLPDSDEYVSRISLLNDSGVATDPPATIYGQAMWIAFSGIEPA
jgi:hypothetical protein